MSGKVQAVYYRKSAKLKADELHLSGWVRNEPDSNVYIEVEGDEAILKQFADWCKLGPPNAIVVSVKIEEDTVKGYSGFEIRKL